MAIEKTELLCISKRAFTMIGRLWSIFNKKSFDLTEKDINLWEYHSIMKFDLIMNGLFFNNPNSLLRFVIPFINIFSCTLGLTMMSLNAYHCIKIKNVPEMSESLAYWVVVEVMFIQQCVFLFKSHKARRLYGIIEMDFNEMKKAPDNIRKTFFDNQLIIWKLIIIWDICPITICLSFMLKTTTEIIYQQLIKEFNVDNERPFIFKIWLPNDDVYRTPLYEIFLSLDYLVLITVMITYTNYICLIIQFVLHSIGQFDIISMNFNELFEFMHNERMSRKLKEKMLQLKIKSIVDRHQKILFFVDEAADILGLPIVNQMIASSIELCLTGFQLAEGLENGKLPILFLLFFTGTLVQLFIPNAIGAQLTEKASHVADICYSCNWENYNIKGTIEKDLQIFLLRASQPLKFCAMGLVTISLETFSSIMSTAGSYFTMLRQMNESV